MNRYLKYDRFGLEEEIIKVGYTTSDLDSIIYAVLDSPDPPDEDTLTTLLMGVRELHEVRMQELMEYFENLIHENAFTDRQSDVKLTADAVVPAGFSGNFTD
jgi:hypothetical protein